MPQRRYGGLESKKWKRRGVAGNVGVRLGQPQPEPVHVAEPHPDPAPAAEEDD
ncbi:hypothetical protein A2U01_0110473, partial [Trifolium medium]|nr:hypothetical protein [Trifolium medium]